MSKMAEVDAQVQEVSSFIVKDEDMVKKYSVEQVIEALEAWLGKFGTDIICEAIRETDFNGVLDAGFASEVAEQATIEINNSLLGSSGRKLGRILEAIQEQG